MPGECKELQIAGVVFVGELDMEAGCLVGNVVTPVEKTSTGQARYDATHAFS